MDKEKARYRTIVYKKDKPDEKTIVEYTEKIQGQSYEYDETVRIFERMNKVFPQWSHEVEKI